MISRKTWAALAGAIALQASSAAASSFVPLRSSELAQAPLIVRATAEEVSAVGNYDPNGVPCTVVRLSVIEVIKGSRQTSTLEFCSLGGIEPDGRLSLPIGIPTFNKGETYLLFLNPADWAVTPVINGTLGMLREVQDGDRTIFVSAEGTGIVDLTDDGFQIGDQIDKSEQIRLLQSYDIPVDMLEIDSESGEVASLNDVEKRTATAREEAADQGTVLQRLRDRLPPADRIVTDAAPSDFSLYSESLFAPAKEGEVK